MPEISPPDRGSSAQRLAALLDLARAALDVPAVLLELDDRAPLRAGYADPAALVAWASADVHDRSGDQRGLLTAYADPAEGPPSGSEAARLRLSAAADAIGDALSVDSSAATEMELRSAVRMTRRAGRSREQRDERLRRHVGALLRGHVAALRDALDDAVGPSEPADEGSAWRGAARRAVALERAAAWTEELERLLDDVAVAREGLDEPQPAVHRLEDLVSAALDAMAHLGHRLGAEDGSRVVSLRDARLLVDGEAVQRVLQHLLSTALLVDFGGERAEHVEIDARCDVSGFEGLCVIAIDDDGPGARSEELRRLLAEGVGGSDSYDTGLSLGVVRAVAVAHGGRCWIGRSELGGARVCLALPAAPADDLGRRRGPVDEPMAEPPEQVRRFRHPSEGDLPGPRDRRPASAGDDAGAPEDLADETGSAPDNVRGLFERR